MNRIVRTVGACVMTLSSASVFAQAPVASEVTMAQDADRRVTITYKLDQSAVVTIDIETNVVDDVWASIGLKNVTHVTGEANRRIVVEDPATVHTAYWNPDASWPGQKINRKGTRAVVKAWADNCPPDWMSINLNVQNSIAYYETQEQIPGGIDDTQYKTDHMLFRKIHAAGQSFNKGVAYGDLFVCKVFDSQHYDLVWQKMKSHRVSFTNDYYFAIYKATVRQMYLAAGLKVSDAAKAKMNEPIDECPYPPVDYLSTRSTRTQDHYDWPQHGHEVSPGTAVDKIRKFTGVEIDFPTDAQWEFACRAGEDRLRYDGANDPQAEGIGDLDWYAGNISDASKPYYPVGAPKKPNAWGIYNLYGNGYEWLLDKGADAYDGTEIEPVGPIGVFDQATTVRKRRSSLASDGRVFFWLFVHKYGSRVAA